MEKYLKEKEGNFLSNGKEGPASCETMYYASCICPSTDKYITKTPTYWCWKTTGEQESKDATPTRAVFLLLLQSKALGRAQGLFTNVPCQVYEADDYTALFAIL